MTAGTSTIALDFIGFDAMEVCSARVATTTARDARQSGKCGHLFGASARIRGELRGPPGL
jgi:hypothetical protein